MKFKLSLIVAGLLALAMGSTRATYAAPPKDACSLLTPAQVNAALGVAPASGKGTLDQSLCEWSQGNTMVHDKGIFLLILGSIGTLTPAQRFDAIKMPLPVKGIIKTPVSGLGDDAVYGQTGSGAPELTVKKGKVVFQIKVVGFPVDEIKAKEKALALDVLAKL
ncbi:MAG TPA: hypothetical protein VJO16_07930 [Candidatus Acidoferrum sp.]|nr:hypothetical protein [Candidatus Acidoferrum sp.]